MTVDDFDRAARMLRERGISVRTFVLLRPPGLSEADGIDWAVRSIEHAFESGAGCCSVIPTRGGNGIMDQLQAAGEFRPPVLASMESVLERGIALHRGRVFIDLWDVERFLDCPRCGPRRADRLRRMNLSQQVEPPVECDCRS
jgi:radical SAM enzyme (TIGR01210 family)